MPKTKAAKAKAAKATAAKATAVKALKAEIEEDKLAKIPDKELDDFRQLMTEDFDKQIQALQMQLVRQKKEAAISLVQKTKQAEIDALKKRINDLKNTPSLLSEIDGVKPIQLVESDPDQKPPHSWVVVARNQQEVVIESSPNPFPFAAGKSESGGNLERQLAKWQKDTFRKQMEIRKLKFGSGFNEVPAAKESSNFTRHIGVISHEAHKALEGNPNEEYVPIKLDDADETCKQSILIKSPQCRELILSYGIAINSKIPLCVEYYEGTWYAVRRLNNTK